MFKLWKSEGSNHFVAQAELLPTLVAKETWQSVLEDARIIHFVDNDRVKAALVTGHTKSKAKWYWRIPSPSRVPSPSNVADEPSRLHYHGMNDWDNVCISELTLPSGLAECVCPYSQL